MKLNSARAAGIFLMWMLLCIAQGTGVARGATLQWNENPEPDVAYYTVYADSSSGTTNFAVMEGRQLMLDGLLPDGTYTLSVTATSAAGLESERSEGIPYTVRTIEAPTITGQPQGTLLASGADLTLSVSVASAGSANYEWRKDGQPLAGATSASFTKTNVTESDSGSYSVVVSNAGGSIESEPAPVTVQTPPSITTQPQSVTVATGTRVQFSVGATGTGLRYQWFRNGQGLTGRTNATITISNARESNQGTYQVVVSNLVGNASSTIATLSILNPPVIVSGPSGTNIATGGTIRLEVSATGTAPFAYAWFKDGQSIPNATGSELVIMSAGITDSGEYSVRVSNAAAAVTSSAAVVTVFDIPSIVSHPDDTVLLAGAELELLVLAQGTGPLAYQWFQNDSPIAGATNANLQSASATLEQNGVYEVVVSNSVGTVRSDPATVRVLPRIVIVQQPTNSTVELGGQLTLEISATGPELLSYQWYRGAVELPGATNAQLQITPVQVTDGGGYTVQISSEIETLTSTPAVVTVTGSAPNIVAHPQSTQAVQNSQLQLSVSATGPELSYQWLKGEEPLPGAVNPTFAISNLKVSDQGNYRVRVSNPFGSAASESANISIIWPPQIVTSPAHTNVAAGGTIQLAVSISGTAPFNFAWLKDGLMVDGATNSTLLIPVAATNHTGTYELRVSNSAGSAVSDPASAIVIAPPHIVTQPLGLTVLLGTPFELSVVATSSAEVTYQWYLNGSEIAGAVGSTLEVSSANAANAGLYTVQVSNMAGSSTSAGAAVVVLPPITILEPPTSVNLLTSEQLRLAVNASGPSSMSYRWYRDQVELTGATNSELSIANVSLADAGSYTVEISSALERKVSPAAIVTVTEDPGPATSDCTLTLSSASVNSLKITGEAPANANYELQHTDSLTSPNWQRIQNVTTRTDGTFEVTIQTSLGSGFIRTIRR